MNSSARILLALALMTLGISCGGRQVNGKNLPPPRTVAEVDLERYAGTWYEIGHLPFRQQRGCHATTATYSLIGEGRIEVLNRCRDGALDGPWRQAKGRARPVDASGARLKVSFFWPFYGPYWVLALDEEYRWAMVGTPSRKYLWLLSREPEMPLEVFSAYLRHAAEDGYEVDRLILTPHEGVDLTRYRPDSPRE